MLLAVVAVILALGAPGLTPAPPSSTPPRSLLPATQPGLGRDEGVFLVTSADDGSQAIYFIAQNTRHSILVADMQAEQRLNGLWPVRPVLPENVRGYPEAAPIGAAKAGLLKMSAAIVEPAPAAESPAPAAAERTSAMSEAAPADDQTAATSELPVATDASGTDASDATAADEPTTYTVKRGDTAFSIARRFGVDLEALLAANRVANRNRLYADQLLIIPG